MSERDALRDAAVLWVLDGQYQRVVDAAVACLVADVGADAVSILAGSSPGDHYADRQEMVAAALAELGLPDLPADPEEAAREGVRVQKTSVLAGALTPEGLADWTAGSLTCETRALVESALERE